MPSQRKVCICWCEEGLDGSRTISIASWTSLLDGIPRQGDIPFQTISNYIFFISVQVTNILVKSLETTSLTELNIAWRKAGVSEEIVFEAGQKYAIKDQSTNMVGLWYFQYLGAAFGFMFVSITVHTMQLHDVCYVIQGPPGYNLCPLRNKFHLCNLNSCTEISAGTIQSDKVQRFCQQHLNFKILIKCLQPYHSNTCWQEYFKYIFWKTSSQLMIPSQVYNCVHFCCVTIWKIADQMSKTSVISPTFNHSAYLATLV